MCGVRAEGGDFVEEGGAVAPADVVGHVDDAVVVVVAEDAGFWFPDDGVGDEAGVGDAADDGAVVGDAVGFGAGEGCAEFGGDKLL